MSRSQFQSKRFILTHAWLNLWDERMTTGRINQIVLIASLGATLQPSPEVLSLPQTQGPALAALPQSKHKVSSRMLLKTAKPCLRTVRHDYSFAFSSIPCWQLHTAEQQSK